jgi:hypothetical protein
MLEKSVYRFAKKYEASAVKRGISRFQIKPALEVNLGIASRRKRSRNDSTTPKVDRRAGKCEVLHSLSDIAILVFLKSSLRINAFKADKKRTILAWRQGISNSALHCPGSQASFVSTYHRFLPSAHQPESLPCSRREVKSRGEVPFLASKMTSAKNQDAHHQGMHAIAAPRLEWGISALSMDNSIYALPHLQNQYLLQWPYRAALK